MARAWIQDRWLKSTETPLPDGTTMKVTPPAGAKRTERHTLVLQCSYIGIFW